MLHLGIQSIISNQSIAQSVRITLKEFDDWLVDMCIWHECTLPFEDEEDEEDNGEDDSTSDD